MELEPGVVVPAGQGAQLGVRADELPPADDHVPAAQGWHELPPVPGWHGAAGVLVRCGGAVCS